MASTKTIDMGEMPITWSPDDIFKSSGYNRGSQYHPGAKLVSILTIKWYTEVTIVGQGTMRTNCSSSAYLYTYPKTEYVYGRTNVFVDLTKSSFYDDTLDDKLGGEKETLGG